MTQRSPKSATAKSAKTPRVARPRKPKAEVVPGEDKLPTKAQIAAVAKLADAAKATASAGTDGDPILPSVGDADDAALAVDSSLAVEGNDDDVELPDRDDAKVSNRPARSTARIGAGVDTDATASLATTLQVHVRSDGATITFDKVTVSRGERIAAIAAFDAELV